MARRCVAANALYADDAKDDADDNDDKSGQWRKVKVWPVATSMKRCTVGHRPVCLAAVPYVGGISISQVRAEQVERYYFRYLIRIIRGVIDDKLVSLAEGFPRRRAVQSATRREYLALALCRCESTPNKSADGERVIAGAISFLRLASVECGWVVETA